MKDVEKFKELLEKYAEKVNDGLDEEKELEKLIQMYTELLELCQNLDDDKTVALERIEELEEPKEKPVIRCKAYKCKCQDKRFFSVTYLTEKTQFSQSYACNNAEEKEGMLITDDFIFIKEEEE